MRDCYLHHEFEMKTAQSGEMSERISNFPEFFIADPRFKNTEAEMQFVQICRIFQCS